MSQLVKKIRTNDGDLQIDYNALANKPTVASLGAVSKLGDTMTGNLIINNADTSSALGLQAPNDSDGKSAYSRIYKNASATADYGLQLRDYAHGGNETGDSSTLIICSQNEELKNKLKFAHEKNGVTTMYRLYGEHNKPTISELGITATTFELNKLDGLTATTEELNYCDGVTSNIQTQLNSKADSQHNHSTDDITSGTLSSDRLPVVPIEKGGTGATTVAGIRTNLGNLGKVYKQNPVDTYVANNTTVTLASLTLPAGTYVVTGNHTWNEYTAGAFYNDAIRNPNDRIYCFVRNLMDNGGGATCCAIVELTEETTLTYETRHYHTAQSKVQDVHFYAIKIK